MDPVVLLLAFLIFASTFLFFLAIAKPKQREDVEERLKRLTQPEERPSFRPRDPAAEGKANPDALADLNTKLDSAFKPFVEERFTEGESNDLAKLLQTAGRYAMTPLQVRVWQVKCAVLMPLGAVVFAIALFGYNTAMAALMALIAGIGGYWYPVLVLRQEGDRRRNAILKQLPTVLDLLTVCVEAGLSLQASLQKVVEKTRPSPLREEIDQVLREIQLGRPRGDALKEMARRVGLKEINSVVMSMIQTEAMGTSVAKSLRVQSEIARDNRIQRAQEQAMQAPVKLSFPLVFFIFPVVFIVIFGPVALELFTNWSAP
ncbi:MAG: type II secretion system F family protein [Candidatus Sericytochromatia bacterium]|nr:type II secretion system F family protein [Candidatus Sericytochromatia bacterium]